MRRSLRLESAESLSHVIKTSIRTDKHRGSSIEGNLLVKRILEGKNTIVDVSEDTDHGM